MLLGIRTATAAFGALWLGLCTAHPSGPASAPVGAITIAPYLSAFAGYRRFDDQPVQSWRDANATVERIGGWLAYARESADQRTASPPDAAGASPGTAPPASSAQPASAPTEHTSHHLIDHMEHRP